MTQLLHVEAEPKIREKWQMGGLSMNNGPVLTLSKLGLHWVALEKTKEANLFYMLSNSPYKCVLPLLTTGF